MTWLIIALLISYPFILVFISERINLYKWRKKEKKLLVVIETSRRYCELLRLQERYHFYSDVNANIIISTQTQNRNYFNRFDFDDFFEENILEKEEHYLRCITKVQDNKKMLERYQKELESLPAYATENEVANYGISYIDYQKLEHEVCKEATLDPIVNLSFECDLHYTSPHGRVAHCDYVTYTISDFFDHQKTAYQKIKSVHERKIVNQEAEYQRRLMTDSLRYDILKRDGFRCQLCGRTVQEDGVKLHVDHIVPVSKGGKTVESNLRTLCETCNLGKRDKYDPLGPN